MATEIRDWIREIMTGAIGSVIGSQISQSGSSPNEDERANLFLLFQELPPHAATVMWKRHQEAVTQLRESRFVSGLTKIPADKRKEAVIRLAQASDVDFQQALTLLNPETGRAGETAKRLNAQLDDALQPLVERLRAKNDELKKQLEEESIPFPKKGWLKKWTRL